jgi:hypothetical protein
MTVDDKAVFGPRRPTPAVLRNEFDAIDAHGQHGKVLYGRTNSIPNR